MEDICSVKKRGRDLTVDSLKVAGKEPVRDVIIVTPNDATKKSASQATFAFGYRVSNEGYMASKDFENLTYFNDKVVSRQQAMALGPNESKVIKDQVALDIKDGVLLVRLDAFSKIAEDDETNNDISSTILFKGFQGNAPAEPHLHIEFLRICGKTPVQGRIKLNKKEAVGEKQGRLAMPVEFVLRNYGIKPAQNFDNLFLLDGKKFFRQPNVSLEAGESRLVQIPVYIPVCNGKLTVHIDANDKYPKGPGCNQEVSVQINF